MHRLEQSAVVGCAIRQDDAPDMAMPTWELAKKAVRVGGVDEAIAWIDYGAWEDIIVHDEFVLMNEWAIRYIANHLGEEEVARFWREWSLDWARRLLDRTPRDIFILHCAMARAHQSKITVTEDEDKYVVESDPCGSGGKMFRNSQSWQNRVLGVTEKAYPWSWGKIGIPYYCCHCCSGFEIVPIDLRGYPLAIIFRSEKPEDPCIRHIYKRPELIPEEYFTRVGKMKIMK